MKLEDMRKIFNPLYEDYVNDLSGWSMMNTCLGGKIARDEYYYNRTLQLCIDYCKALQQKEYDDYDKNILKDVF